MERRNFLKTCCYSIVGAPIIASSLQSCQVTHYATARNEGNRLVIAKSEFWKIKNGKRINRSFVLIGNNNESFPICVQKLNENKYVASLMKCTHQGCELNVGGGIYTCPCHGSEFSITGEVLEGPAEENLKTFEINTDNENIYIHTV